MPLLEGPDRIIQGGEEGRAMTKAERLRAKAAAAWAKALHFENLMFLYVGRARWNDERARTQADKKRHWEDVAQELEDEADRIEAYRPETAAK